MSKRPALGRGLEALLPGKTDSAEEPKPASRLYDFSSAKRTEGRISEVETSRIRANPYQPRETFDNDSLTDLANSIRELGIIQPVTVRLVDGGFYELISGERRVRAARQIGLEHVPAYVREADTEAMLEMALVENVQRQDLDPIEIALGYQRLIEECSLTQEVLATKIGRSRSTITNTLRLLNLPPAVQVSLRMGRISEGHARALLSLEDEALQAAMLKEIEAEKLSVRQVEHRVRTVKRPDTDGEVTVDREERSSSRDQLEIRSLADQLRARYATRVQIKHQSNETGGRIELQYYSVDDLDRLMELLLRD